jgi:hypothetical protein
MSSKFSKKERLEVSKRERRQRKAAKRAARYERASVHLTEATR